MSDAPAKPLVTLGLVCYKQEAYIEAALAGALAQSYEPLEIIIIDDCSPDNTFELVESCLANYRGPHQVRAHRNARNQGVTANVADIFEQSRGEFVFLAAGDDIPLPHRVARVMELYAQHPDLVLIDSASLALHGDDAPQLPEGFEPQARDELERFDLKSYMSELPNTLGGSRSVRMQPLRLFPRMSQDCPQEDRPLILRSLMVGNGARIDEPLLYYRLHPNNMSKLHNARKMNYAAFHQQYIADIDCAFNAGRIDADMRAKLLKWAARDVTRRKLLPALHEGERGLRFMAEFLSTPHFSLRDKLYAIKTMLFKPKIA